MAYLDSKDWPALAKPDPEWEETVKTQMGGNAPDLGVFPDIQSMRTWITNAKAAMTAEMGPGIEGVVEKDHQVTTRDNATITCRTYQPEKPAASGSPLAVIFHGGGWCIGGLENEELLCRLLTSELGMTCVNVDYRLAPEHKYPAAAHDCFDATKWAAKNASSLGADPSKGFIVGGTSAGGELTCVIGNLWRDGGLQPPLTGLHMMIPAVCAISHLPEKYRSECTSYEQNKNAAILSQKAMDLFIDNYIPDKSQRGEPTFSPMLFEQGVKGLPPTYYQIAGMDPLRDEALIYERMQREAGIKTKVDMYAGFPHGFWSIVPNMNASKNFVKDSVRGVQWLLQQK